MSWNLRRVYFKDAKGYDSLQAFIGKTRVLEVYYSDGVPWAFAEVDWWLRLRFIRDWRGTPVLTYPDDFTDTPPWGDTDDDSSSDTNE